jgi:hypothetical protein
MLCLRVSCIVFEMASQPHAIPETTTAPSWLTGLATLPLLIHKFNGNQ